MVNYAANDHVLADSNTELVRQQLVTTEVSGQSSENVGQQLNFSQISDPEVSSSKAVKKFLDYTVIRFP